MNASTTEFTPWLMAGSAVAVRRIDKMGHAYTDMAIIKQVSNEHIVLTSGEMLYGIIDPEASVLGVSSTPAGADRGWEGHMGALPNGPSPSNNFGQKWTS